ncbi:MAG: hypothetical protein ACFB20_10395, partial [Opitutales bacterium]
RYSVASANSLLPEAFSTGSEEVSMVGEAVSISETVEEVTVRQRTAIFEESEGYLQLRIESLTEE